MFESECRRKDENDDDDYDDSVDDDDDSDDGDEDDAAPFEMTAMTTKRHYALRLKDFALSSTVSSLPIFFFSFSIQLTASLPFQI